MIGRSRISIVIPTLDEATILGATLGPLKDEKGCEIIVVDGGSRDDTVGVAEKQGCRVIRSGPGRAGQMNLGAREANGGILLFLHGDTILPAGFSTMIHQAMEPERVVGGAFSLAIDSSRWSLRVIAGLANLRSRYLRLPYGDQALFTSSDNFRELGGFPDIAIMEDFVFVRNLARLGNIVTLDQCVVTSARRWEKYGVVRTTLLNQVMVCGYHLGGSPERLARWYQRGRPTA